MGVHSRRSAGEPARVMRGGSRVASAKEAQQKPEPPNAGLPFPLKAIQNEVKALRAELSAERDARLALERRISNLEKMGI